MGEQSVESYTNPEQLRRFMKCVLNDLRALEQMLESGLIESGVRRIGAEQELVLANNDWRPEPVAVEVLSSLADSNFTTELARFNLEFNLEPLVFGGDCLRRMEQSLSKMLETIRVVAREKGAHVVLTGILPTLSKSDLDLNNITPRPRYLALNEGLKRLRGGEFEFRFTGTDELIIKHDSVMLEACNTSCQFHFQVGPEEFSRLYNIAQAVSGPVLSVSCNSPLLFGQRLWRETRIALFQQAVDTRTPGMQVQERSARVSFGSGWIKSSAVEIFREDISRFRAILGAEIDEDPFEVLERGEIPKLKALQLHNSTVYRWNRPCYGISDGKPHLRIEARYLPSGPSVVDEMANAAFWFGLMSGVIGEYGDISEVMEFDVAKANFSAAAQLGLDALLTWTDGKKLQAQELICERLLPLAREGLAASGIDSADIDRYLGIIEDRARSTQTGSQWMLDSLAGMAGKGGKAEQLSALVSGALVREMSSQPVHTWDPARIDEAGSWRQNYARVDQFMTTDLFTVHADEVIDLVANLMDWQHIRHVPVEDDQHRLVGLVSYRSLLRFLARDLPHGKDHPVPVSEIMNPCPITVGPETSTLEAITIMKEKRVACLPVVKEDRLVGIITERDLVEVARELLEIHLRG